MKSKLIGRPVIIRSTIAGVHAGILEQADYALNCVTLKDAYRLWRYYTRDITGSVSDVASHGLCEGKEHQIGTKLSCVEITNKEGLEIAEMTDEAYESLKRFANYVD